MCANPGVNAEYFAHPHPQLWRANLEREDREVGRIADTELFCGHTSFPYPESLPRLNVSGAWPKFNTSRATREGRSA